MTPTEKLTEQIKAARTFANRKPWETDLERSSLESQTLQSLVLRLSSQLELAVKALEEVSGEGCAECESLDVAVEALAAIADRGNE